MRLGAFEKISGTNYLVAPLSSAQTQPLRLSERQTIAIHNYLFVNVQDQSSRWLFPNHERLILALELLADDGTEIQAGSFLKAVNWLVFTVVNSDTDADKRSDRKTIGVAEADGSGYAEVMGGIETVFGKTGTTGDNLLVLHRSGGKNRIFQISLRDRKVTVMTEMAAIPW